MLQCLTKPIFEKHNLKDLIAHLQDIPDIILEVQHHLSLSQKFGGTDGRNGVHVHVTANIPQLSSEIVGKINHFKDRPTFLALS